MGKNIATKCFQAKVIRLTFHLKNAKMVIIMEQMLAFSQFFLTSPTPCPYVERRVEGKIFALLSDRQANTIDNMLGLDGFRRSSQVVYRPACYGCKACISVRVRVSDFSPSSSQKRVSKLNARVTSHVMPPLATREQYDLFRTYLDAHHASGGISGYGCGGLPRHG